MPRHLLLASLTLVGLVGFQQPNSAQAEGLYELSFQMAVEAADPDHDDDLRAGGLEHMVLYSMADAARKSEDALWHVANRIDLYQSELGNYQFGPFRGVGVWANSNNPGGGQLCDRLERLGEELGKGCLKVEQTLLEEEYHRHDVRLNEKRTTIYDVDPTSRESRCFPTPVLKALDDLDVNFVVLRRNAWDDGRFVALELGTYDLRDPDYILRGIDQDPHLKAFFSDVDLKASTPDRSAVDWLGWIELAPGPHDLVENEYLDFRFSVQWDDCSSECKALHYWDVRVHLYRDDESDLQMRSESLGEGGDDLPEDWWRL